LLEKAVTEKGRIVGVDLTDAMLDQARNRVRAAGWQNVDLVQADLAQYTFPSEVAGILSTFAITLVPEYDEVIRRGADALRGGGRMAIFDLKKPEYWPDWLFRFTAWLNKPYGVSMELAYRHPWWSIRQYLREVLFQQYYFGYLYLSVGEAPN
jgi:demethylmenaquinone methyltransferase/2-methoxy-6-polyprenyl-1,4-benzoquinol methylase